MTPQSGNPCSLIKSHPMKITLSTKFLPLALGVTALGFSAGSLLADEPVYPVVHTTSGVYKNSNGEGGTFVETVTKNSADSTSDVIVYTRGSDQATSTDTRNVTKNGDGTKTVDYRSTQFGSTAAFASHKTITREKNGQFVGTGTYTTADGTTGTLTTLESQAETVNVVSAVYRSTDDAITNDLRLEDSEPLFHVVKTIHLGPDGKATTLVHTRYVTDRNS